MINAKATKRALIASVVALLLCFTMLIGTTFAWFTDSVTSANNVVQAGKLDVELWQHYANGTASRNITDTSDPIFGKDNSTSANSNSADTLWEPGKTQTVYLSIKNNGTLDLKYKVAIEVTNVTKNLTDVVEYIITPDAKAIDNPVAKADLDWTNGKSVVLGINVATEKDTALIAGQEHFFALSVHMDELANNDYQGGNITFNIKVLAGQLASEDDSFDNQYDKDATYPDGWHNLPDAADFPVAGWEIPYVDANGDKIGTITLTSDSVNDDASMLYYKVTKKNTVDSDFVVSSDKYEKAYAFDIDVDGIVEGNTSPILVELRIDKDLDGKISVYHKNEAVTIESYNATTGMVKFYTTSFSPFTILINESTAPTDNDVLKAELIECPEFVNSDTIEWGSYGKWSPTNGVEAHLDACYKFVAPHDAETVENCKYKDWWVDFVLELDAPLGADGRTNEIFLGGSYGDWGWIGFHSGDLELDANTEVPVLASASGHDDNRISGWTYEDIASFVGEFTCGVGNVGDSLVGATITVTLRITNPDNLAEHIDVNTVTYTFK